MKKIICLLLLACFAPCIAFAQVSIDRESISIFVSQTGNAQVKEEITIEPDMEGTQIFENLVERGETDFEVWKTLIPDLELSVGSLETPILSGIKNKLTDENYEYKVIIEYEAKNFANLKSTEGRIEKWEIDTKRFVFYDSLEKKFVIPEKVFITLTIEDTRKDRSKPTSEFFEINPSAIAQGPYLQDMDKVLFFINGPIFAENFEIKFNVEKPITEVFGSKNLVNFFMQNPIYIIILVALLILLVVFRKHVLSLVGETFISEEDIILPRKK